MNEGRITNSRPLEAAAPQPCVGVIYNPRSHRNKGQDLLLEDCGDVHIEVPQSRADIVTALREFAALGIDYLVINGGDGTVRDVLTCGMDVFGDDWPALAVLPKGKTNALNVDLGAPAGWTVCQAVDAFASGKRVVRRPLMISRQGSDEAPLAGFIIGAGGFSLGVKVGQDAHRMGAFNSLAVGVSAAWGVAQALLGSDKNRWRRGTVMDIRTGADHTPMRHSGDGYEGRRSFMLASTLEKFPVGLKLFGLHREGLKICALDRPRRGLLARLPWLLFHPPKAANSPQGLHQCEVESLSLTIEDDFILDGEAFPGGSFLVESGPPLRFVIP